MGLPGAGCGLWCEPGTSRASVFRVSRRHAFDGGAAACLSPLPAVSRKGCVRFRGRAHRPPHPLVGTAPGSPATPSRDRGPCQPGLFEGNVRGRRPAPTGGWTTANRDGQCAGTAPRTYRRLDKPQTATADVRGRCPAPTGGWTTTNSDGQCAGTVPRTYRGLDSRKPRRPMCGDGAPHLPGVGQTADRDQPFEENQTMT